MVDEEGPVRASPVAVGGRVARYVWHDHHRDLLAALAVVAEPLRALIDGSALVPIGQVD